VSFKIFIKTKEPRSLYEPIEYMLSQGGKKLRPALVEMAYRLYKNDVKKIAPYAAATEIFHNFSLVHDDIMDMAPMRRGKPTVHKKWGLSTGILAGDVMLVKVYELFALLPPPQLSPVLQRFNQCAVAVCEGQQRDMEFETKKVSMKEYLKMIEQKTAALLGFSLELGAMLAKAPAEDQLLLRRCGLALGLAFQLADDLLDVYGGEAFGKQAGGDILANKKTYLLLKAYELANVKQRAALNRWISKKEFEPAEKIKAVAEIYHQLDVKTNTQKAIDGYGKMALSQLSKLPIAPQRKKKMESFFQEMLGRTV